MKTNTSAILLFEDGREFHGNSLGYIGETTGEICFNTGMSGYQEILTDPSYCKQIVTMTSPHIGNYGVNTEDIESDRVQVAGFIIKEATDIPSNWMNGIISAIDSNIDSLKQKLLQVPSMSGLDLAKLVTTKKSYAWSKNKSTKKYKVAAIDYGIKHNILRLLESYGCNVTVFPANTSANEIMEFSPDGIFLSNGPGDPAAVTYGIDTVKSLLGTKIDYIKEDFSKGQYENKFVYEVDKELMTSCGCGVSFSPK